MRHAILPAFVVIVLIGLVMLPSGYAQNIPGATSQYLPLVFKAQESPTLAPTLPPTVTSTPSPTATSGTRPTEAVATATTAPNDYPLVNGNFEQDTLGWTLLDGGFIAKEPSLAHGGYYFALLGGSNEARDGIQQKVRVPQDRPFLAYWYSATSEHAGCYYDSGFVWVDPNPSDTDPGSIVDSVFEFCNSREHAAYRRRTIDLRAYAGQVVTLEFIMDTDSGYSSFWSLDDLEFVAAP